METTANRTMPYVKPEVLSASNAKSIIRNPEAIKRGHSFDGTLATSPAYGADE